MTDDIVDDILVCISRMWSVCRFSQFRFLRDYSGNLFCLARFFVMAAIGLRRRLMRYTIYGDCLRDAVLDYSHGSGAYL